MTHEQTAAVTPTVLVADDDAELRRIIVEYLTAEGLAVVEVEHGLQVLLHVRRLRPQVVVIDVRMPCLGGIEALERIRAFSPETAVIVITGTPDIELHVRAIELGVVAILPKPFALPDLRAVIEDEVGGQAAAPNRAGGRAARILIVDDEPDIRDTLTDLLREDGYVIHTAVDGAAALTAVVEHRPDVVLLDVDMPRLRGVEALVAIRELSPATQVIMMSGKADAAEAKRALTSGAFDYVTKPFDLAYLDQAIRTALLGVA